MKAYLKYMPILCVVISFGVFISSIIGYENHLKTGKTMYIRLAPVDPRSILQGDYMELRYELHLVGTPKEIDWTEENWVEENLTENDWAENGSGNELVEGEVSNTQADIEASESEHEAQAIHNQEMNDQEMGDQAIHNQEMGGIEADNQEIDSQRTDSIDARILEQNTAQEAFDQKWETYQSKRHITAYAKLNERDEVIATHLEPIDGVNVHQLQLKNPYRYWRNLYPATKSFMFAEGLAQCYEQAKFAKLSVSQDGKAMLVDLVGEDLNSLDCESQSSWAGL